ncbi:MAG: hypothetical protein ACI4JS_08275 [Oscillospiraceae bacterium]
MKHTLEKTLGELSPSELDQFNDILLSGLNSRIPHGKLKRIEKITFENIGIKHKKRRLNYRILVPVAVGLVLCFGGAAVAAEAREYNAALDFFSENDLSVEGLSRTEVKAVYRDISTQSFTNDKTVEVIRNSVPGTEILQEQPTPEELSTLWNNNLNAVNLPKIGTEYKIDYNYKDDNEGVTNYLNSTVECFRDGKSVWKNEFGPFLVEGCTTVSGGTVVWGATDSLSWEDTISGYVAFVDESGKMLWQRRLEHGFKHEYIEAVVDNGDGTFAVFGYGYSDCLSFSVFDLDGNEIRSRKMEIENNWVLNAARLGDGYMVQLNNAAGEGNAEIITLDSYGNITDNIVYEGEDCDYYIMDMAEFEGRMYLSAYAVPKQTDEGGRHEIAGILNYIFKKNSFDISPEELTPIVRDNYTAVLLLCDPNGGEPKQFYSAKGSLGGKLTVENGELKWDVNSVIGAAYSPYTGSFSIAGNCQVYRYTFESSGKLAKCEKTDETVPYFR